MNDAISRWALEFHPIITKMVEDSGIVLASSGDVVNAALRMAFLSKPEPLSKSDIEQTVKEAAKKVKKRLKRLSIIGKPSKKCCDYERN